MEAKEDFEQSVSRQQRSMWAAAGGWGAILRSGEEDGQRRQSGIAS